MTDRFMPWGPGCHPVEERPQSSRTQWLTRREEGQSLALLVLMMTVAMGLIALAVDGTFAYSMRSRMQTAADTAAMAAANEISLGQLAASAVARANQTLAANGADLLASTVTVSGSTVTVTARTAFATFFASVVGFDAVAVQATARATVGLISQEDTLMPFAVEKQLWQPDALVSLWGDSNGPGNFGWVHWTGQTANTTTLQQNLNDPENRSDRLVLDERVNGHTGVSFGAIQQGLNQWIGQQVTVFLYDPAEIIGTGGNLTYKVRGFARFEIINTISSGSHSEIWGRFIGYSTFGVAVDPSRPNEQGDKGVVLVQ